MAQGRRAFGLRGALLRGCLEKVRPQGAFEAERQRGLVGALHSAPGKLGEVPKVTTLPRPGAEGGCEKRQLGLLHVGEGGEAEGEGLEV